MTNRIEKITNLILEEINTPDGNDNGLAACLWDGDAGDLFSGYVIRVDGAMLPFSEFQYGFRHLDEMAQAGLAQHANSGAYERAHEEAPSIQANVDRADRLDVMELIEGMVSKIPVDGPLILEAARKGELNPRQVFDLIHDAPGLVVSVDDENAANGKDTITPQSDVVMAQLVVNAAGGLEWNTTTLIQAGQSITGRELPHTNGAVIPVPGGCVKLSLGQFEFTKAPGRSAEEMERANEAWKASVKRIGL